MIVGIPRNNVPYIVQEDFEISFSQIKGNHVFNDDKYSKSPLIRRIDRDPQNLISKELMLKIPKGTILRFRGYECQATKSYTWFKVELLNSEFKPISDYKTTPKIILSDWSTFWPKWLSGLKLELKPI
jgi:hypothetical protein